MNQTCSKCNTVKPLSEFKSHKHWCRDCKNKYNRDRHIKIYGPPSRPHSVTTATTKICGCCKQEKPLSNFSRRGTSKYYRAYCKQCTTEKNTQWGQTLAGKRYRSNWEKIHRQKNPGVYKDRDLKKLYGIGLTEWLAIFEKQGKKCAICRKSEPNTQKGWQTDHDHETEQVRGIVCGQCNSILGYSGDNPEILLQAAAYLVNNSQLRDELVERKNDEFAPVSEFD